MRNLSLFHKMCTFFSYVHLILSDNFRGIFVVLAEGYMPSWILSTRQSSSLYFCWSTQNLAVYTFGIIQVWLTLQDTCGKLSLASSMNRRHVPGDTRPLTYIYSVDNELNNESISMRNLKEVEIFFPTETLFTTNFV